MDIIKSSFDKRQSVQKNYDLIAEQWSMETEFFDNHTIDNIK